MNDDSRWQRYADNSRVIAWADETFASTSNAKRVAAAFTAGSRIT